MTTGKYWIKTSLCLDPDHKAKLDSMAIVIGESKQSIMRAAIRHMHWHFMKGGRVDGSNDISEQVRSGILSNSRQKDRLGKRRAKKRVLKSIKQHTTPDIRKSKERC